MFWSAAPSYTEQNNNSQNAFHPCYPRYRRFCSRCSSCRLPIDLQAPRWHYCRCFLFYLGIQVLHVSSRWSNKYKAWCWLVLSLIVLSTRTTLVRLLPRTATRAPPMAPSTSTAMATLSAPTPRTLPTPLTSPRLKSTIDLSFQYSHLNLINSTHQNKEVHNYCFSSFVNKVACHCVKIHMRPEQVWNDRSSEIPQRC